MKPNFRLILVVVMLAMLVNGIAPQPARASLPTNVTLANNPQVNALIAKAEEKGPLPVIVSLNVPYQPEGELVNTEAVNTQIDRIQTAQAGLLKQLEGHPVESVKQFKHLPAMALTLDAEGMRLLKSMPEVAAISEDKVMKPILAQSVALIKARSTDTGGFTGAGWAVAVLDTGVDKAHPFLANKVISEACYSTNNSYYDSTSVCPGGAESSTAVGSGTYCKVGEDCYHGTHVSGIAAGKGSSFSGVASGAKIIAVQVFSKFPYYWCDGYSDCVMSFESDQIAGLERVYELSSTIKIASVNLSLGGGEYYGDCDYDNPSYKAAVDLLLSAGVATVVASGNDGFPNAISSPACYSNVYSVGSTGDGSSGATADAISSFSNRNPIMEFFAPGQWITSSIPGGKYATWSGTSMATPHVAGAWAVLRSREPYATVNEIYTALRDTGKPIAFSGITRPRISVGPAVTKLHTMVKPTINFNAKSYSVMENAGKATITVKLTRPYSTTVTVNYATSNGTAIAGQDYTAASGTLTFSPGQTSKSFTVAITNDTAIEPNETVNLTLSSVVNATAGTLKSSLTIVNDDAGVQLGASSYTVAEEAGYQTVEVKLTKVYTSTVTVDYATIAGTATAGQDFGETSGTLVFQPGETVQTIDVPISEDDLDENEETFTLKLSNPSGAPLYAPSQATIKITDNDETPTIKFTQDNFSFDEAAGTVLIGLELSAASGRTVTANITTTDITASIGQDYTIASSTLTFAPGETQKTIQVVIINDPVNEIDQTFTIQMTNLMNTSTTPPSTATITIVDDDSGGTSVFVPSLSR